MFSTITKAAFVGCSPCIRHHWNTTWTAHTTFSCNCPQYMDEDWRATEVRELAQVHPASQWQNHPRTESKPLTTRLCLLNKARFLHLVTKLCLTLCNPMDCCPPSSSIYGILQARILEWVAISFSWPSSRSRDQTRILCVSCIARGFFTTEPLGKPLEVN